MTKKLTIESVQLKRGTAAAWTSKNPVLKAGEPGLETDTKKLKFGDGATAWTALEYFAGDGTDHFEPPVLAIARTNSVTGAEGLVDGEQLLNTSDGKLYTWNVAADGSAGFDSGTALADGTRIASSTDHQIYTVSGGKATGAALDDGVMFFCRQGSKTYVYSASDDDFIEVGVTAALDLDAVIDGGVITAGA